MQKIVITTTTFGEYDAKPLDILKEQGFNVVLNHYGRKLKTEELTVLCKGAEGIIAGTEHMGRDVLEKLSGLRVISRCGSGMENVDMIAARELGIKVFGTPDAPTLAVAELTVGLILSLLRKTNEMDRGIRNNEWLKLMGNLLLGKKVVIIGLGRVGRKVAELLKSFNCELAYVDPAVNNCIEGIKRFSKEAAFAWADIVCCHVSTQECIIGEKEIMSMKKGGWIVNVSRGGVVDERVLYLVLKSGHLAGAAIDVFMDEPYCGPLKELSNVILTPHIGSYAKEARIQMERESVENLINGLKKDRQI
jgi:D-3-phosphoglycerate dehydrogenase